MISKLKDIQETALQSIKNCERLPDLDQLKSTYAGKSSPLNEILKGLKDLPSSEKPLVGKEANLIKANILAEIGKQKNKLEEIQINLQLTQNPIDTTLPTEEIPPGNQHPITQTIQEIMEILNQLGFSQKDGPEIETDFYNFEALNIPENHPARDMHDTFYLTGGEVLRTHTSPTQIHTMLKEEPPIKIAVPGKVYRCDADVTHSPVFHQIEGLYVDKNVKFSELKGSLDYLLKALFGNEKKIRYRPSYFPFTEPSTEVDVSCVKCNGSGCSMCKQTGWLEILGAGMVHPNVFRSVSYNPEEYTGFAFGLGVERIAMLKYGIQDIRLFYENDNRFLEQF